MHTSLFILPLVVLFLRPGPAVRMVVCLGVVYFFPKTVLLTILYYPHEQPDTCKHFYTILYHHTPYRVTVFVL